jgi:predicted dehydrogenase
VLRIGIVGSDNSHAIAFSQFANVDRLAGERCRVVGIWGEEPERTHEVAQKGQIATVVQEPQELLDQVDAVLVVDRHGDLHAEHALPFLEKGIATFVDKPFAIRLEDCRRMLKVAEQSEALLTSFSTLRYASATDTLAEEAGRIGAIKAAHFAGPCDFESQHGGPFFYATHVADIALRLIGEEVETLRAHRSGKTVAVQVIWKEGAIATFTYLGDAAYHFHATLFGTEGMAAREITAGKDAYGAGFKVILDMVETGNRPLSDDQLLRPVAIVHAVEQSLKRGGVEVSLAGMMQGGVLS